MNHEPHIPIRLRQLINAVCDEVATDAEIKELDALLRSDKQALQSYTDYCRLHVDLHFVVRAQKMAAQALHSIAGKGLPVAEALPVRPAAPADSGNTTKSPVLGFLGGIIDYVNHSRMLMFWLMALVVSGWFIVQLGSLMTGRARPGNEQMAANPATLNSEAVPSKAVPNSGAMPNSEDVSHPPGGPFANSAAPRQSDSVAPTTAAWLTATVDCHWRVVPPAVPPASAPAPGDVDTGLHENAAQDNSAYNSPFAREPFHVGSEWAVGQQLDLVHGLAEITFRSGARIILNGPARFVIASKLGGTLQLGKLTARVPHDATGFAIDSPAGKVVDLGTEFGVAVAADRTMEVEVFRGEVAVSSSGVGSSAVGPSGVSSQKLTAGHAARVVAGQPLVGIPPRPSRFVVGLGPREDPRKARTAYVNWMRSMKPVVWFRMEGQPADRVLHDEMGGPDAKVVWNGPGNPFVEGRLDKSLWLRGNQLRDYALLPKYPQAEDGKLTVSVWVYAESRPARNTIISNWANLEGIGQFLLSIHAKDGGKSATLLARITQRDGKAVSLQEPDAQPFPLFQWQHIAFTTDGTTFRLYRQGREIGMTKHAGLKYPVRLKMLGIGAKLNDAGTAVSPDNEAYWDGKLDEIAIFNNALSADDIREIAAAPP